MKVVSQEQVEANSSKAQLNLCLNAVQGTPTDIVIKQDAAHELECSHAKHFVKRII